MAHGPAVKTPMPRALFRCDASPAIGGGHVSRCLAIAEALADAGWHVAFAVGRGTVATVPAVAAEKFAVHELTGNAEHEPATLRSQYPDGVDLLVTDHYQRDIHFEEACRTFARQILVLDDATGRRHDCDFLLDAATSDCSVYAGGVPAQARLLLGPAYALMRRSFVARRGEALARRDGRPVEQILVSFGATDPWNATPVALDALADLPDSISITVALSSRAPHLDAIRQKSRGQMQIVLDADMAKLMTEADLAIGAPGASSYERAVLGLPSIAVTLADDQRGAARVLTEAGAAIDAGRFDATLPSRLGRITQRLIDDAAARSRMTEAAAVLVDGRGSRRLLSALVGEDRARDGSGVRLRLAEKNDEEWLLQLQQAPQIRRYARNPAVPDAKEHASWMARTLADANRFLLVVEAEGERAGSLRLDRLDIKNAAFEVSIAICPNFHGRGIGSAALSLARRLQPGAVFDAEILPDNVASRTLFLRAGFRKVGETRYRQFANEAGLAEHGMPARSKIELAR
jgi:UDP-2,4-diacetamido-2,4,6-trideoxy-beta-L-altropyranose hydrolase